MPTSAVTQRRRVVDAVAHHRHTLVPGACSSSIFAALSSGKHLRQRRYRCPARLATASGDRACESPVSITTSSPLARRRCDRIEATRAEWRRRSANTARACITFDEVDPTDLPACRCFCGLAKRFRSGSTASIREQRSVRRREAHAYRRPRARRGRAWTRSRCDRGTSMPLLLGARHDQRLRDGMLGIALERPRPGEALRGR